MVFDKIDKKKAGKNIFLCILLVAVIALYNKFSPLSQVGLMYIVFALAFFLFVREIVCWYWKINEAVVLLNKQIDLMSEIKSALKTQNKILFTLLNNQNKKLEVKKQLEK